MGNVVSMWMWGGRPSREQRGKRSARGRERSGERRDERGRPAEDRRFPRTRVRSQRGEWPCFEEMRESERAAAVRRCSLGGNGIRRAQFAERRREGEGHEERAGDQNPSEQPEEGRAEPDGTAARPGIAGRAAVALDFEILTSSSTEDAARPSLTRCPGRIARRDSKGGGERGDGQRWPRPHGAKPPSRQGSGRFAMTGAARSPRRSTARRAGSFPSLLRRERPGRRRWRAQRQRGLHVPRQRTRARARSCCPGPRRWCRPRQSRRPTGRERQRRLPRPPRERPRAR